MKKKKWICLLLSALLGVGTALPQQSKESPVEKVKKIGDKLIRETPFAYKLGLASCSTSFNTLNFVDFGRTFGWDKKLWPMPIHSCRFHVIPPYV